jgi:hypothetical protein
MDPERFDVDVGYRDPLDRLDDDFDGDRGGDEPCCMSEGQMEWLRTLGRWARPDRQEHRRR